MLAKLQAMIIDNEFIPHDPTPKQAEFLMIDEVRDALYGGAAGGGKSDALLMAALKYVHVPGYAAIIFRRTFTDLAQPGALIPRAHEWLDGTRAKWKEKTKTWVFPSGATLTFAYLQNENDKFNYQGAEFQFIGFDELTQFEESQFRYLFSRLRRLKGSSIPLRVRSATNPGGRGHGWVKQRYLTEGRTKKRVFVPASLNDNPHLDADEYKESLEELDPVTRRQLLAGDWDSAVEGDKFKRHWFEVVDDYPRDAKSVRYWDLAATEPKPGKDPDWTAGVHMAEKQGIYYIVDVRRDRLSPKKVEDMISGTAAEDGRGVIIHMEQEPGSSGVNTIDHYQRTVLKGYAFYGDRATGNKEIRANPLSSAAEAGNVKLVSGPWITDFLDELTQFPGGLHDDQCDAASGAFSKLHVPKKRNHTSTPAVAGVKRNRKQ